MTQKLPCPVCKSKDIYSYPYYHQAGQFSQVVGCNNPDCPVEIVEVQGDTEAEAIKRWNTRT